jgi:hypothetical protein
VDSKTPPPAPAGSWQAGGLEVDANPDDRAESGREPGSQSGSQAPDRAAGFDPAARHAAAHPAAGRPPQLKLVANSDDPSPDDRDAEEAGLIGAPLILQELGGEVISETTNPTQ